MPIEMLPTSPDQQAKGDRKIALQFGVTDEKQLDLSESITWLIMEAAVEAPQANPLDWVDTAFSVTKPEDFKDADLRELDELTIYRAHQASMLIAAGQLFRREAREEHYKLIGIEV